MAGAKDVNTTAFHAAQKELRDSGLEPYYWAGFILME